MQVMSQAIVDTAAGIILCRTRQILSDGLQLVIAGIRAHVQPPKAGVAERQGCIVKASRGVYSISRIHAAEVIERNRRAPELPPEYSRAAGIYSPKAAGTGDRRPAQKSGKYRIESKTELTFARRDGSAGLE